MKYNYFWVFRSHVAQIASAQMLSQTQKDSLYKLKKSPEAKQLHATLSWNMCDRWAEGIKKLTGADFQFSTNSNYVIYEEMTITIILFQDGLTSLNTRLDRSALMGDVTKVARCPLPVHLTSFVKRIEKADKKNAVVQTSSSSSQATRTRRSAQQPSQGPSVLSGMRILISPFSLTSK